MQKWEYLFVTCEVYQGDWRPRVVNGKELQDWKRGPVISTYSNQLGEEGWELVNLAAGAGGHGFDLTQWYRLVFKRPKM